MLPQPIRTEEGLFIGGDPGEVAVRITSDEVAVAAYAVMWEGQSPRLALEGWKRFPVTAQPERVASAIIKARARRLGTYRWCPRCGSVKPPEAMLDNICQDCAESAGVVL
jgi:hypothetical protein